MTEAIGGSNAASELADLKPWADVAPLITPAERAARLDKLRLHMAAAGIDMALVDAGASLRYFAGVPWGQTERLVAMLVPLEGDPVLICPTFELGSLAADLAIAASVRSWEEEENPFALVADVLRERQVARLGIDPEFPFGMLGRLRAVAPGVEVVDLAGPINACRMIKSAAELAIMRQAKQMTLEVHRRAARIMRAGITASEVRRFIEAAHRALGAPGNSFCIVEFGRSSAFPHGLPGDAVLAEGDIVLIDTGCPVQGYSSDITRTYVFGEADAFQREIWALERAAQQAAFDAVRPGVLAEEIDAAARKVLEGAGLGPDYRLPGLPHRTGHGIGLSIHEPAYLVRGDKTPLAPGMCFSNEPMIVIPDRFGVRLEDHFHVTENGAEWFTRPAASIDDPI
ncbi:MAG TPA: Xaa-Pro peptidase family protein [Novosphingobium sp.]|nr:Xaa-Pro peptidase family protein [Novosphingobium sp.]